MTITTTGKIALIGAGMATLIAVAVASHPKPGNTVSVAITPWPSVAAEYSGMKYFDAADKLASKGFNFDPENGNVKVVATQATNCTSADVDDYPRELAVVNQVETRGDEEATMYVTMHCNPPAPAPAPVHVDVPNVNAPNVNVPRVHVPRSSGGGESRFCRKRWWC